MRMNTKLLRKCLADAEDRLLIVEGRKDSNALKSLGVKNIILLNGRPLAEFALHVSKSCSMCEPGAKKEAVILTDFDSEGRRLAGKLSYLLKRHKVMVNSRVRMNFMKLGKNRIEDFREGDVYGEVGSDFDKVSGKGHHESRRPRGKAGCDRGSIRSD